MRNWKTDAHRGAGRRYLLATAAAIFASANGYAEAPGAADDGETVVVTARRGDPGAEGYVATRTTSAMRSDTALVDTPQSVAVVTAQQIEDQAASGIGDAIRYTPGVFVAQGEGNRETIVLRGNSSTADFFLDGVRDDIQTYRDLYNIDELQVFRGPNAMIFGRGGAGGVINRVTKVADGARHLGARVEAGSYDHARAQLDLGGGSAAVSGRITGVIEDSGSYRDGVSLRRWGLNPTAAIGLGAATTVTLGYEHFDDRRTADRGVSSFGDRPLATRPGLFFGDPANSVARAKTDAATLFFDHRFGPNAALRNRTRYAEYDKFYQNVFAGAVNVTDQVNPVGLPTGRYVAGTIVAIQTYNNATTRRNWINQTDLNLTLRTGAITHTLLVGAELGRQRTVNRRLEGFFPTATNPAGVTATYAAIVAPQISRPDVIWRAAPTSTDNRGIATVAAGYMQDQIAFTPRFQAVLGIRYERFRTRVSDERTLGFPVGQQRDFDVVDTLWSPRAGLLFKPIEHASIYASYSQTYLPRGGDQLTGLNLSNQTLAPEKYRNYELGAKWDGGAGLSLTAAAFRLDRDNVLALSDPNNPASATVPVGRQRTEGVELSAVGRVVPGVQVVGAFTYADARFLDAVSGTVQAGNRIPNVPKYSASLWGRFDPGGALGGAIGLVHQGRRFAATDNAVTMPGYVRIDGALYYRLGRNLDLQVNIENLFDTRYFLFANSNTNITPASPTAARVGLNARF